MRKDHNEACINIECNSVKGLKCTNNKCTCPDGKYYDNKTFKCGKYI